ncbi:hypothetical protein [Kordiimonas marina]|uniref:hypothetical protein n=1 Tax=Kordiimonas marina TaxID=2872312 RepID=UPI001FF6A7AA|nr:hypothetical protein [Kordiimonas marina]MCJ9427594.1 hypothetical protein [Kordiimonas marina]
MAKKPQQQPKKAPMRQRRRRKPTSEIGGLAPLVVVGLIGISMFKLAVAGLLLIGLLPTFVLGITGRGEHKNYKLQCVAFANIAGVLPFVRQVWDHPRELMQTVIDPLVVVIMFGSAAIGYALIYVGPMVAAVVLQSLAQERLKTLSQQRTTLVEAWGPEVLGAAPSGDEPDWANKTPKRPQ